MKTKLITNHANHFVGGVSWKTKLSSTILGAVLAGAFFMNLISARAASAPVGTVGLAWDNSPSSGLAGYRVYMGTSRGNYTSAVEAGNATTSTLSGLVAGTTYYFAVKAYNASGVESAFSNEISFVPAGATLQLSVNAGGQAVLTIKGVAGRTYDIEATQDLRTWRSIGNVTVGTGGTASYTDATAPSMLKRFYRTRDLQP